MFRIKLLTGIWGILMLHTNYRCDGTKDCNDGGTDEASCPVRVPQCQYPSRLCDKKTKCIGANQLCNGEKDCKIKIKFNFFKIKSFLYLYPIYIPIVMILYLLGLDGSDEGGLCGELRRALTLFKH